VSATSRQPRTSAQGGRDAASRRSRNSFLRLVAIVTRRDYLRTVARRGFILGTLLLPIGMGVLLLLSSLFSSSSLGRNDTGPGQLVIVNQSNLQLVIRPQVESNVELVAYDAAIAQLNAGSVKEIYVIPSTYPAQPNVQRIEGSDKTMGIDSFQRQQAQEQELDAILRDTMLTTANVPAIVSVRLSTPSVVTSTDMSGNPVSSASVVASFILPYVFTLAFVLSIFITSGYLLQSVTEEKENRVVEIVLSSIPALPLMAGKIVGLGLAGLTQVVIWLLTVVIALPLLNAQLATNITITPVTLVLAVVYFALGYLAYGAIFAAIGSISPGSREANQYSSFFGIIAVVPLIFSAVFLTDPNSPVVWVLVLFPLTTPAAMLEVLAVSTTTPWAMVVVSLAVLLVFVPLAIAVCARVFRATLLLYGVRPNVRQIVGAVLVRS
jgi:ABC-2 type transport system permease protein